ncbi:MAG: hypothetical protein WC756_12180 [Taibaiella sp.]|jgi:membrane protein DedA with SNARE-associated domain
MEDDTISLIIFAASLFAGSLVGLILGYKAGRTDGRREFLDNWNDFDFNNKKDDL